MLQVSQQVSQQAFCWYLTDSGQSYQDRDSSGEDDDDEDDEDEDGQKTEEEVVCKTVTYVMIYYYMNCSITLSFCVVVKSPRIHSLSNSQY